MIGVQPYFSFKMYITTCSANLDKFVHDSFCKIKFWAIMLLYSFWLSPDLLLVDKIYSFSSDDFIFGTKLNG